MAEGDFHMAVASALAYNYDTGVYAERQAGRIAKSVDEASLHPIIEAINVPSPKGRSSRNQSFSS